MQTLIRVTIAGLLLVLLACSAGTREDARFETMANQFVEEMLPLYPEWATGLGDHRFDDRMGDYSLEGIAREMAFHQKYLDSLAAIDVVKLNTANKIDYDILTQRCRYVLFSLDTLRGYEWNPRNYGVAGGIYGLLARDFAPLEMRLKSVKGRLAYIPGIVDAAKANLKNPPRVHTETAIRQNAGAISYLRDGLDEYLADFPELKADMQQVRDEAVASLEAYGEWLESTLLPASTGDFRLGEEKYRVKLGYRIASAMTAEEILAKAEEDLVATQEALYQTALPLFRTHFPDRVDEIETLDKMVLARLVLDRLAEDHPTADNSVEMARACLDECEQFVREHDLVSVPEKPIKIIVMPEFAQGVAVAYCDSPGPLEKNGETFYAVSPPPQDWDDERVESYFREYNDYMMRDLTVHEAMPGHYLQAAHGNRYQSPTLIRSIYGSGTFAEGWATYCEQLMVEFGFGGPEVKMQQLKMRLRMIINAIIDQKIHMGGMTEDEAMAMMIEQGLQERGEAAGKWRRACLGSTQLSTYYVGNLEFNALRDAYEARHPDDMSLKSFHDQLISFGSPPPKYLKILMDI